MNEKQKAIHSELDEKLEAMNKAKGDRLESNIGQLDIYWPLKNDYIRALNEAGGVHIPQKENLGVDIEGAKAHALELEKKAEEEQKKMEEAKKAEEEITKKDEESKVRTTEEQLKSLEKKETVN